MTESWCVLTAFNHFASHSASLETTNLYLSSFIRYYYYFIFNLTSKWDDTVFVWFISLSIMNSGSIHIFINGRIFIWLNRISLFFGIYICIYILKNFYPFSIYGHLGCFYVMVIVNNAKMDMGCRYLFKLVFWTFFLLRLLDNTTLNSKKGTEMKEINIR